MSPPLKYNKTEHCRNFKLLLHIHITRSFVLTFQRTAAFQHKLNFQSVIIMTKMKTKFLTTALILAFMKPQ